MMHIHLHFYRFILVGLIVSGFHAALKAQSPTIQCPVNALVFDDTTQNDPALWHNSYWLDPFVLEHNLAENAIPLEITATNNCPNNGQLTFRYILSLDLDGNHIPETFIDSDSLPLANYIYFNNKTTDLFSGTVRQFDTRNVVQLEKWGFRLQVDSISGSNQKARVIWQNDSGQISNPAIPYGTHKIKWVVTDVCGESAVCEYEFSIKDVQKPEVVCINGISVNVMNSQNGLVQLWASDFLQYTKDNYTPSPQIKIAIRESGTGTGFPSRPDGTPQTGVSFSCNNLGMATVELWTKDKNNNTNFCETTINIFDNAYICGDYTPPVYGTVITENGIGISGAQAVFESSGGSFPAQTFQSSVSDTLGNFRSNPGIVPVYGKVKIRPVLDLDPLNGINTWDLVVISRHILGLTPLSSPYKIISADANQSGTVTTFDVVELRKLILGTYPALPDNTSWRFIDKNHVFSDLQNPFADTLKTEIELTNYFYLMGPSLFIGCKIGDVDISAAAHFTGEPEDRNDDISLITIKNRQVRKGETFTAHFDNPSEISALQFTLNTRGLKPVQILPGPGLTADHFGIFSGGNSDVFASAFTTAIENGNATFEVAFTALTDGLLSDMLQISNDITPAMAFGENGKGYDPVLRFVEEKEADNKPVLFQNTPNPWTNSTRIPFYLPEDGQVEITVFDQHGTAIDVHSGFYLKGYHQILLNPKESYPGGLYLYQLKTAGFTATKKAVFIKH